MTQAPAEEAAHPRSDLLDAALWIALGAAAVIGAWRMDRLEDQDVPPFGAPGLLPGLLGLVVIAFGGLLLLRSLRRGARPSATLRPANPATALLGPAPGRALWVIALCILFGAVLVGHGLPFWAAATLFVTAAILSLRAAPDGARLPLTPRAALTAATIGLGAGLCITLVFQQLFLVRLP